jgi:hypothetical protein
MKPKPQPPEPQRLGPPPRYAVLVGEDIATIIHDAEELIDRGMIPAGGISTILKGQNLTYVQTLYRQPMKSVEKME